MHNDAAGQMHLDIIICSFNNATGLTEVLERLCRIRVPADVRWAVLVVDNASTDNTRLVVENYAQQSPIEIRYVYEPEQGLTPARLRGVRETRGDWVAFVDDDNLPEPGWLEATVAAIQAYPLAGGIGGWVQLRWDQSPPEWVTDFGFCFAEQDLGSEPRQVTNLVGAGMILKREALEASGWTAEPLLADRIGKNLISGGDAEIALRIAGAGYQLWYAPDAVIQHQMSPRRATRRYLLRINYALGASTVATSLLSWPSDYEAWRTRERAAVAARLKEAWKGLLWSLRTRRKLTAAIAWMSLALGLQRGLRDIERLPRSRREALMGRAAAAVAGFDTHDEPHV